MRGTQENVLRGPVGHFQAVNPVAMRMEEGDAEAAGEGNLQSGTEKAEPETTLTKGRGGQERPGSTNQDWPPGPRQHFVSPHATHYPAWIKMELMKKIV
eukprot:CAMPEP_0178980576 /NCGR_PEP_ID=MMETSP0789-20121207/26573_1 /TAXON_ID=3005 /ORGANISM="Rhizosolenia setigera, Strain CCMP 1694" /LENGTH=98 /DNA_ID=CAMNT_0020671005 /DNA_START=271 /DNA_END=568 /DNA_ORIENTATION=+